jgi:hypothetical protein
VNWKIEGNVEVDVIQGGRFPSVRLVHAEWILEAVRVILSGCTVLQENVGCAEFRYVVVRLRYSWSVPRNEQLAKRLCWNVLLLAMIFRRSVVILSASF